MGEGSEVFGTVVFLLNRVSLHGVICQLHSSRSKIGSHDAIAVHIFKDDCVPLHQLLQ